MYLREDIIQQFINNRREFTEKDIFDAFSVEKARQKDCRKTLNSLAIEGLIYYDKKAAKFKVSTEALKLSAKTQAKTVKLKGIKGKVSGNRRGFAFVICEDSTQPDIFIAPRNLHGAMHNDTVLCRLIVSDRGKSDEGEVVTILERGTDTIVGTYLPSNGYGFVEPDDQRYYADIFITAKNNMGAKEGQKVVVNITDFPKGKKNPEGKIIEILGESDNTNTDVLSIIRSYKLYEEFNNKTLNEAKKVPAVIEESEIANREDFRKEIIVTIDGEDAKDLDDAISLTKNGDLYELGVHIADVTHYIRENTALDNEALKRGTSVYFPDRVLPMLPREISNGICSLNPNLDRLTLSAIMQVNNQGKVVSSRLSKSVINTTARMTYTSVQLIIDGDKKEQEKYSTLTDKFFLMKELADILISKRGARGSIDFDLPEAKITIDENGDVGELKPYPRGMSNKIIEEFMILANETVAETCFKKELPFVYRIHEDPSSEKISAFKIFLKGLGYKISDSTDIDPLEFSLLLDKIEVKPEYSIVNKVMLRTMMKAKYSPDNSGHFGLASEFYCHFTSPIRRYPDLMIHRIIKEYLEGNKNLKTVLWQNKVAEVSLKSSEREKLAEEAEREVDDYFKAKYMEKHIDEVFEGIISGVTEFGLFVELNNTVEGMVKTENLPDQSYEYIKEQYTLKGSSTIYKLGNKIKIRVESANARTKRIDFLLEQ